jgi:FtsZ-interacting cell division protein ZipA
MSDDSIWGTIAQVVGGGGVAVILQSWWRARKDRRTDMVESAHADANVNMLADYQRRAKEAEEEADTERTGRLIAERKSTTAESLQHDAEREVRALRRSAEKDINMMRRKLKKAGVPDSDYVPMLETSFGELPNTPEGR